MSPIFLAPQAQPLTEAFKAQPDEGKVLRSDFARDPLNAKKPMQTFEEILQADPDARPTVMSTQRQLLAWLQGQAGKRWLACSHMKFATGACSRIHPCRTPNR